MNDFLSALGPFRRRLRLQRAVSGCGFGFACGAALALVLLTVTAFVPLSGRWIIAGGLAAGGLLTGCGLNALRRVPAEDAARAADGCGLRERCVTALALGDGPETEMVLRQRADACAHLKALDPKQIRVAFPRRNLLIGAVLLALCAGTLLIPGGGDRAVAARQALEKKTAEMAKAVDEAAEAEERGMTEKEKAELRKLTEELKRELAKSRDEADVLVALDKAEQQLEKLQAGQAQEKTAGDIMSAMEALAQAMAGAGMDPAAAESMAEAAASGNAAAMSAALQELSAEELKELAEGLSGEAKETAQQLAEALEAGEMSEAQMQAMMSGMQRAASQGSAMQQALSGMKAAMAGGEGQQQAQGSAPGAGTGSGQGRGQAGAGAGSGTTNEEQKGGGGSGQKNGGTKGSRPAEYKEGEYETIYDPERVATGTRDEMTKQQSLGKDSVQIETGPGKGSLDGNVPFREVVGEYAQQEAQAAESAHLTKEQREWVNEYFRRLTDE